MGFIVAIKAAAIKKVAASIMNGRKIATEIIRLPSGGPINELVKESKPIDQNSENFSFINSNSKILYDFCLYLIYDKELVLDQNIKETIKKKSEILKPKPQLTEDDNDNEDEQLVKAIDSAANLGWKVKLTYHQTFGFNWFSNRGETNYFIDSLIILDRGFGSHSTNGVSKESNSGKIIDTIYVVITPDNPDYKKFFK